MPTTKPKLIKSEINGTPFYIQGVEIVPSDPIEIRGDFYYPLDDAALYINKDEEWVGRNIQSSIIGKHQFYKISDLDTFK